MQDVRVWDRLVRAGHWALATGFFVAYFSAEEIDGLHNWSGYAVAAIVLVRILWGFVGPRRARFSDFVYRPGQVLGYLRDLVLFRSARFIGHSPAGGAMVVALLILLAITTGTGMATLAIEEGEGPLAPWLAVAPTPETGIVYIKSDVDALEDLAELRIDRIDVEELHETFANITLFFVFAHLAGVLISSLAHRENLVRAMITGDKRGGEAADL
jgi:cytochrome b